MESGAMEGVEVMEGVKVVKGAKVMEGVKVLDGNGKFARNPLFLAGSVTQVRTASVTSHSWQP